MTDLWGDETISYFIAKDTSYHDLLFSTGSYYDFVHPPFNYIYLKICLLFGDNDKWLRFTSLVWFFPSLIFVFLIGKKVKDKKTGLIAISLFSLHPLLNNLAFQVRSYAIVVFFMLFGIYLLLRQLEKNNLTNQLLTGLILAIGFYVDYANIWLIAGIFVFGIWLLISKKTETAIGILKTLIFFSIFSVYQIAILGKILFLEQNKATPGSVPFINNSWIATETDLIIGLGITVLSIVVLITSSFILLKENNNRINQFLIISLFSSLTLSIIYSQLFTPIFLARNLVIASIIFIFVISQFYADKKKALFILIILFIYGFQSLNHHRFSYQERIGWDIKQKVSDKDAIVYFPEGETISHFIYYLEQEKKNPKFINAFDKQSLEEQNLKKNSKIFFINDCAANRIYNCENFAKKIRQQLCTENECDTLF